VSEHLLTTLLEFASKTASFVRLAICLLIREASAPRPDRSKSKLEGSGVTCVPLTVAE
jgi:hypothetical protein